MKQYFRIGEISNCIKLELILYAITEANWSNTARAF